MPKPSLSEIKKYWRAGYDLIPLHKFNKIDKHGKERGKSPRDNLWRKKKYRREDVKASAKEGYNIGVRLRDEDLIIDVDPRNFPEGDNVLDRFVADLGLDLSLYPHVITGSGGDHFYMKKPCDIAVRDSLEDYPGIEFKSLGRQVVAAGSVHPNRETYLFDEFAPPLKAAPDAPDHLIKLLTRPRLKETLRGGDYSPEEVAQMLDSLDPVGYQNHEDWLNMMMACHHASGGEARQEFIEWSVRDPEYFDQAWLIGRRWDSLTAKGSYNGLVTYRTLLKEVATNGDVESIPRTPAADDFDEIEGEEMPADEDEQELEEHEKKGPLEKMNDGYCVVDDNGRFRIYAQASDPTYDPPRKYWQRYTSFDFEKLHMHRRVQKEDSSVPITDAWLKWGRRLQYKGVIFDPEKVHPGYLNLWTGWSVEPKKGDWSYLRELIEDVLCDGESDSVEYVLNWAANMIQRPASPAEVAICFQGAKGTGKGTFGRALANLAGQHGLQIMSPEHLTGRFNQHLRDVVCLFADEALSPYDAAANSRLKGLITEPTFPVEGKGRDVVNAKNCVHIVMASNEDWFVPMSLSDERRFFVAQVNEKRMGDRKFFNRLYKQLRKGGQAALLWDMLHRDIKGWHPRQDIPMTYAAISQKMRSLPPVHQWWMNLLYDQRLDFPHLGDWTGKGARSTIQCFPQDMWDSFERFCKRAGIRSAGAAGRASQANFTRELSKVIGPNFNSRKRIKVPEDRVEDVICFDDGRTWGYEIPVLSICRQAMQNALGGPVNWDE